MNGLKIPQLPWPLSVVPTQLWVVIFLYLFFTISGAIIAIIASKIYYFMPIFMFAPSNLKWKLAGLLFAVSLLQYYRWIPEFDSLF